MKRIAGEKDLHRPVREWVEPIQTTLLADLTVGQALKEIRGRRIDRQITYFYVVDEAGRLVGVVPTRRLLLARADEPLEAIMQRPVVHLAAEDTLSQAMEVFTHHRYLALPVVDEENRLLGAVGVQVYADEALDLVQAERYADLFQLMGVWVERHRHSSPAAAYRLRMPWLVCNIAGGAACAAISASFDTVLKTTLVIAAFIPMVLTLSESISIQSLTLSLQHTLHARLRWRRFFTVVGKELITATLIGVTSGAVVGAGSLLWRLDARSPLAIGLSIACAMCLAALFGIVVPTLLRVVRLDPRIAAGPLVLMVGDAAAMAIYLALATVVLT